MLNWPTAALTSELQAAWAGGAGHDSAPFAVELCDQVDSSNSELMRRARTGNVAPTLLVAEAQTAGRGRLGRPWHGAAGDSLTFSVALPLAPQEWAGLSLAIGVALAEALDPDGRLGIGLKWPNDLWLNERKLAGVLVETVAAGGLARGQRFAVIGVGINIAEPSADGLSTRPAWLREVQPQIDSPTLLRAVAAPLLAALVTFGRFGFAPFHGRFDARDVLRGRPVTAAGGSADPLVGRAQGVSENGALLVQTISGMQAVTALEVSVRPAPIGAA